MSKLVAAKSILDVIFSLKGFRNRSEIPVFVFDSCNVKDIQNKKTSIIQESPDIYLTWLASVARLYKVMCKN